MEKREYLNNMDNNDNSIVTKENNLEATQKIKNIANMWSDSSATRYPILRDQDE